MGENFAALLAMRRQLEASQAEVAKLNGLLKAPPSLEVYDDWVRQQVGKIPIYETTWLSIRDELLSCGLRCMLKEEDFPDVKVFHTDEATLAKMIPFLTYPADYAVESLSIDCDDYSVWVCADSTRIFKVNGIYQVWGLIPSPFKEGEQERHAWSLGIIGPRRYKLFEPNSGFAWAGVLFGEGDNGYESEEWK